MTVSDTRTRYTRGLGLACGLLLLAGSLGWGACERFSPGASTDSTAVYVFRTSQSTNGTGKFYMDREIANVIEHDPGAQWLERPEREDAEFPNRVIEALDLHPTDVVADIGAVQVHSRLCLQNQPERQRHRQVLHGPRDRQRDRT